jgi:hypothetical protein
MKILFLWIAIAIVTGIAGDARAACNLAGFHTGADGRCVMNVGPCPAGFHAGPTGCVMNVGPCPAGFRAGPTSCVMN